MLLWRILFNAYTERSPIGPATHCPPSLKYWKQALLSSWRESGQHKNRRKQNDHYMLFGMIADFDFCSYWMQNNNHVWSPVIVVCVLFDAEAGRDSLSVAENSSYRAWANTFTTKECDDLRSQWNFFFAYWQEKKQSVILHTGLQSLTHCRGNNRTTVMQ